MTGIGGKRSDYWQEHLDELLQNHQQIYEDYSLQGAKIAYTAFTTLRNWILEKYEIDVLHFPTAPTTALQIFRQRYLKEPVVPTKRILTTKTYSKKTADGKKKYEENLDNQIVFAGSHDVRKLALDACHGGREEAYVRGYLEGDFIYYDVNSLFPSAAILQPLPVEDTLWFSIQGYFLSLRLRAVLKFNNNLFAVYSDGNDIVIERKEDLEAVMETMFRLDSTHLDGKQALTEIIREKLARYDEVLIHQPQEPPLIQTSHKNFLSNLEGFIEAQFQFPDSTMYPCLPVDAGGLYFPLCGMSNCTVEEIRAALRLGATIRIKNGFVFSPSAKEIDHQLKSCLQPMLTAKQNASADSHEYRFYKLLMNALIGKFLQNGTSDRGLDLLLQGDVSAKQLNQIGKSYRKKSYIGSGWYPEWWALILGKARALMAEFIAKGSLMTTTDSVLLSAKTNINCNALNQLRTIGSDLSPKYRANRVFISNAMSYVLFKDETMIKEARHGASMPKGEFAHRIQGALKTGIYKKEYEERRSTTIRESASEARPLGSVRIKERDYLLKWNDKRLLDRTEINLFTEYTKTKPIPLFEVKKKKIEVPDEIIAEIREMYGVQGLSQRQIAKQLGFKSPGTINKYCKGIKKAKKPGNSRKKIRQKV